MARTCLGHHDYRGCAGRIDGNAAMQATLSERALTVGVQ